VGTYLRNTLLYNAPRVWRGFDVFNAEALDRALAVGKGVVVAGQHLGPQRYSFFALCERGVPTIAAVTREFVDEAATWMERVRRDVGPGSQVDAVNRLTTLAVEEPTCALKMMRALRRGEAVMFDLDGNIGVGGEERTLEGTSRLRFLGRDVHVRQGVAYLGYRSGAPILPVIVLRGRGGRPELHFSEPLVAAADEPLEAFGERALRTLYDLLERTVREHPEQWEMWPHFYKWLAPPAKLAGEAGAAPAVDRELAVLRRTLRERPETPLEVRSGDARVMRIRGRYLFVDLHNFRFFVVSPLIARLLHRLFRGSTLGRIVRDLGGGGAQETVLHELARLRALNLLQGLPASV
jgi:lauroyl/myristoyl acyltransferase